MKTYDVKGMSCAACSARVENAVKKVDGVQSCSVNLLTNSMKVDGSASEEAIVSAVRAAGYDASSRGRSDPGKAQSLPEDGSRPLLIRLLVSSVFLLLLMYITMGHMMLGLPLPEAFTRNHVAMGLTELLLSSAILIVNNRFFVSGIRGALHGAPNMDTLVALGSGASFLYSTVTLFAMSYAVLDGDHARAMEYMDDLWFESAAMILVLITLGKFLEARAKGKTTSAVRALLDLSPKTATVRRDGREVVIPVSELRVGDVFLIRTGDRIPADGRVLSGNGTADESALTGESLPQEKGEGGEVYTATVCLSGYLECEAQKVGEDTTIAEVARMVSDAAETKAPVAKIADKISGIFVPAVIGVALITFAVWMFARGEFSFALARAVSVLVISCPCALGLATPVAIMVGSGVGAKNGVLFKTALSLELLGRVKTVVFDKTGTITEGKMRVTDLLPEDGTTEEELLSLAAALEARSEHPLAVAVVKEAAERGVKLPETEDFGQMPGGVRATLSDGRRLSGGNLAFVRAADLPAPSDIEQRLSAIARQGKTPLLFFADRRFLGVIALADRIKADSREAIAALHAMGVRTVMLTGDREDCARAVAAEVGIEEVIAGVLPDKKAQTVRSLLGKDKVAMVGDGINDAPALTTADVGVAIGAGTDVALEAADVILMRSGLTDAVAAIRIGRATLRNIHENLFWAFFYNVISIPLAAGAFIPLTGWTLSPMIGAAAMSLSSVTVVTNALRLNLIKPYKNTGSAQGGAGRALPDENAKNTTERKEETTMEKTIRVEGMMCHHCEAHVKAALEAIDGVTAATADHEQGKATVTLSHPVEDAVLKAAIEQAGYHAL